MKTVMQFLSLLLCFELVMSPMQGSLLIANANAEEKTCPAGQSYDSSVNRCLTKAEVIKVNAAVQSCGTDKSCYETNAKNALKDSGANTGNDALFSGEGKDTGKSTAASIGTAAAIGIPLLIATNVLLNNMQLKQKKKGYKCNPNSLLLMYAGAAALGAGEIIGYFTHKSKLDKIQEEWNKSIVPNADSGADKKKAEATEAQSQAFEFLAQNEDQVAKTTRLKKGFYWAATGLFAAGTAAAVIEQVQLKKAEILLKAGPGKITLGTSMLTNPQTAVAGRAKINEGKKDIVDSKTTINKITCFTSNTEKDSDNAYEKQDKLDQDEAAKNTAAAEATAKKKALEDAIVARDAKSPAAQDIIKRRNAEDAAALAKLNIPGTTDNTPANGTTPKSNQTEPKNTKPGPSNFTDEASCTLNGYKWTRTGYKMNTSGECSASSGKDEKLKRVAIYNLSTAQDAEQLMQLVNEMESVEFENYSKVTYLDKKDSDLMKKISLSDIASNLLIPKAHAVDIGALAGGLGSMTGIFSWVSKILGKIKLKNNKPLSQKELGDDVTKVKDFISRQIGKPVTRIAINAVLGGWIGIMAVHMGKQAKLSEERAKKLRSMKESFVSANGLLNCTEDDRNDAGKPKCYCYTADNKANPDRASKSVCKSTFASLNTASTDTGNDKVCVTQSMAVDASCSCRNTTGADGKNTCLKTSSGLTTVGFSPATFKMIGATSAPANDLFNGTASGGDIADSAGINAARVQQASEALLVKTDPAGAKESKSAAAALEKNLLATAGGYSMGSSASSSLPSSPAAAAAALDKEIKDSKDDIDVTTSGDNSGTADLSPTPEAAPEFGLSSTDAANQEIEIAEVMGKDVDFGSNDINKTKDTNLFEVLSNRYKRSGMRRLFNEEGAAPADAPAKTELAE